MLYLLTVTLTGVEVTVTTHASLEEEIRVMHYYVFRCDINYGSLKLPHTAGQNAFPVFF